MPSSFSWWKPAVKTLGQGLAGRLASFAEVRTGDALQGLARDVSLYLVRLENQLYQKRYLDVGLAARLASACKSLLEASQRASLEQKALAVGAIRYFLDEQDALNDTAEDGLSDDRLVLNFALRQLGLATVSSEDDE